MFKIKKELEVKNETARIGELRLAHGKYETPFFMPVATKGASKHILPEEHEILGTEVLISNGFLLAIKPGLEVLKDFEGIHNFMNWKKGLFTDSGGFQMILPSFFIRAIDDGVFFKSPMTSEKLFMNAEDNMLLQEIVGADVAMAFDYAVPYGKNEALVKDSVKKTTQWGKRCIDAHTGKTEYGKKQLLFGINQGGIFEKYREQSARELNDLGFDGMAIGGLSIGEGKEEMFRAVNASVRNFDYEKSRYFMGLGSPDVMLEMIGMGIDIFDSAYPTRIGRHGNVFTTSGIIDLEKGRYRSDKGPIDEECECPTCKTVSRAFVHHLLRTSEELGKKYAAQHNIFFVQDLMKRSREEIKSGNFFEFKNEWLKKYREKTMMK